MTLPQIEAEFVNSFQGSQRRPVLYRHLEEFFAFLMTAGFPCELWVDGSLLTQKEEPDDLDLAVIIDRDAYDQLTDEQRQIWDRLAKEPYSAEVDSFAYVRRLRGDPFFADESLDPAYSWSEQYLLEHSDQWLKGYVVVKLRETDVGLRICS